MRDTSFKRFPQNLQRQLRRARRPHLLLLLPLVLLTGFLTGGMLGLFALAVGFPLIIAVALPTEAAWQGWATDPLTGLLTREGIVGSLDSALASSARKGRATGAIVVELDQFRLLEGRFDRAAVETVLTVIGKRLADTMRDSDQAGRLDGATFAVALSPVRRLDLEAAIQLSARIQQALTEPIPLDGTNIHVSASVGFSLANRLDDPTGERILQAATTALIEAQRSGPAAIRSYSAAMHARVNGRSDLTDEVAEAMDRGEFRAFFQPQISTRTGAITGFETLARWMHPTRGLIPPAEFLPALVQAGLMPRLGQVMVQEALTALRRWTDMGLNVPRVGVNFSNEELHDPHLVDRISWELDRFDLPADRLVIEVLETVVANRAEDITIRNLAALARLGCSLDLDDFGTGHASITSIRRFSIERIKIDRSFVTRIDADAEQQKMVEAILTMAERLGLDTLAEGVETSAERAMLARLGCGHIQGFAIARPMSGAETDTWIDAYANRQTGVIPLHNRRVVS
jgi:diguanylate cyclase (GGDEF)-like protein